MDLNFWAAIFTIVSGFTSIISLYFFVKDRKPSSDNLPQQNKYNIIVPDQIKTSRLLKRKRRTLFNIAIISIIICILSTIVLLIPRIFSQPSYPPAGWKEVLNDSLENNSNGYNWGTDNVANYGCEFIGGVYQVRMSLSDITNHIHYCYSDPEYSEFAFEIQMTIVKGDQGGIIFRVQAGGNSFYYFHISEKGVYGFNIQENNGVDSPISSGFSSAIHIGLNQINLLAVVAQGNKFELYVNHELITTVIDKNSYYGYGHIGVIADDESDPTEVIYSNAKVWIPSS